MLNVILVFIGGGLGAIARYGSKKSLEFFHVQFYNVSLNIMFINILGSCLFGLFLYVGKIFNISDSIKLLFLTGFISSFTTYSTFIYELSELIHNKNVVHATGYLVVSLIVPVLIMLFFISKV